jgi:hypothetical protein
VPKEGTVPTLGRKVSGPPWKRAAPRGGPFSCPSGVEPAPELLERERVRLVALRAERLLEVGDERPPELEVSLRSGDDVVQLPPRERKLLRGPDPPLWDGPERPDQLRKALFVVCVHLITRQLDDAGSGFLPSRALRSFPRHREMRLAIVPAGMSSAAPIVW